MARRWVEKTEGPLADAQFCAIPAVPPPVFSPNVTPERLEALLVTDNKWANGTILHYYFFDRETDGEEVIFTDGTKQFRSWVGAEDQREMVRRAFQKWKDLGMGLNFREVSDRDDAEVRIGFMSGDGSWSHIGTYILNLGANERTMNFGWSLTARPGGLDTATHEIGHTLGMPHEHQNPNSGIEWNEEAVYAALALPPNGWSREVTFYNIIRKLDPGEVRGSDWDPDSIMHYPFGSGLIRKPEAYANGLRPHGGLSPRDIAYIKQFYPPLEDSDLQELLPSRSVPLNLAIGEQANFLVRPDATRYYNIRTFGACDTIIVLFEDENGSWRYRTADDDAGEDRNATLRVKLIKGHRYAVRVRLKYSDLSSPPAVMMW